MVAGGPEAGINSMKRFVAFVLTLFLPCTLYAEPYEVQDHETMLALVELQEDMDLISSSVMGCLDVGREHIDCMCANKALFSHFSETVTELFDTFPELENYDLVTFKDPEGVQVTQSMEGIKKQAAMELDCEGRVQ